MKRRKKCHHLDLQHKKSQVLNSHYSIHETISVSQDSRPVDMASTEAHKRKNSHIKKSIKESPAMKFKERRTNLIKSARLAITERDSSFYYIQSLSSFPFPQTLIARCEFSTFFYADYME